MKKILRNIYGKIRINKSLFIFLLIIVIIGVGAGSFFSLIMDNNDKELVTTYLTNFFNSIKDGKLNYDTTFTSTLIFTLGFALFIWLLGISVIGFFVIIVLLFLKAFVLGFVSSNIIINYKFKGIVFDFVYLFPHQIINMMIFILISAYALMVSYKLIDAITKKKVLDFKNIINKFLFILIFSSIVLIFTSLYEVYVVPRLLSIILKI